MMLREMPSKAEESCAPPAGGTRFAMQLRPAALEWHNM